MTIDHEIPGKPVDLLRVLDGARKELLDLTTRNRLLSTPRHTHAAKALEIVDERSDQVARILLEDGRAMNFEPVPTSDGAHPINGRGQPAEPEASESGLPSRHVDTELQTSLTDEQLQKRLLGLYYDSRTHEEEQGVNILYLALAFLKWKEAPASDRHRFAPLILLPVRLVRSEVGGRIRLQAADEDLNTNLSLQAKLRADFGIELPELPERDELVPSRYCADVRRCVAGQSGWEVIDDDIVLSFFSFAKFLMYRDLDPSTWPVRLHPGKHRILSGLLVNGFEGMPPLWPDGDRVDDHIRPIDQVNVVDADSSQTIAIEGTKRGRDAVIQGPPGTGKSQTITNLIAASVMQGKRVLFVAEKMAALEVVHSRMANVGLGQLCLELHSRKANKKAVLAALQSTLGQASRVMADVGFVSQLESAQHRLNHHADMMHGPVGPSGLTPYRMLGELVRIAGRGVATTEVNFGACETWTRDEFESRRGVLAALCERIGRHGVPGHSPWRGVGLQTILPSDRQRLAQRLASVRDRIGQLQRLLADLAVRLRCESAYTLTQAARMAVAAAVLGRAPKGDRSRMNSTPWREGLGELRVLVDLGREHALIRERLVSVLRPEAWRWDPRSTREQVERHGSSPLRWLRRSYRDASRQFRRVALPTSKGITDRIGVLRTLEHGLEFGRRIGDAEALGAQAFGEEWRGADSDWASLHQLLHWVTEAQSEFSDLDVLGVLAAGSANDLVGCADCIAPLIEQCHSDLRSEVEFLQLDLQVAFGADSVDDVPVSALGNRIEEWQSALDRLPDWLEVARHLRALRDAALGTVAERLFNGQLQANCAVDAFTFAYHEIHLRAAMREHAALAEFRGVDHDELVAAFQDFDRRRIQLARQEVAAAHAQRMPSGGGGIGEMGVLAHEFGKKRRHLPVRKLMAKAGNAIQCIKPVFMMSPVSISQFLPTGNLEFDLLVIDEASQVKPVDAFGAILRSKQIVVVGDDRQLPPTDFFGKSVGDEDDEREDEPAPADLESILGLCSARGMPSCMLRWHYRSQHESLIAVSNREFYDNRLFVVPSPYSATEHLGLKFRPVEGGFFDRGGSQTNRAEAQQVAAAAIAHARQWPHLSLGIGTFSAAQRDAVLDELDLLWRTHEDVREFFGSNRPDPFFVKNLETIQGDERDVIFISVGYGRDRDGNFAMRFGPLNNEGGERRLNVLISRARVRCEVFSSIRARDIDVSRARGRGVSAFKTFLQFAEEGRLDVPTPSDRGHDSPFEEQVHETLCSLGYAVDAQVGSAGFFVDLAVKDPQNPGRYVLGVECDGATYHSSRSARDRDRLRQQLLESRGWIIHRIWSTDWFQDPARQASLVAAAIEKAIMTFGQRDLNVAQGMRERASGSLPAPTVASHDDAPSAPPTPPEVSAGRNQPMPPEATFDVRPYVCTMLPAPINRHPEQMRREELEELVGTIIGTEGPIHEDEVARRVTSLCGLNRTGSRVWAAVEGALLAQLEKGLVAKDGAFYDVADRTDRVPVRSRADVEAPGLRKPECLPPSEIRSAIQEVLMRQVGVERDDAVRLICRLLGFKSTSAQLAEIIGMQVEHLRAQGQLAQDGTMLRLARAA